MCNINTKECHHAECRGADYYLWFSKLFYEEKNNFTALTAETWKLFLVKEKNFFRWKNFSSKIEEQQSRMDANKTAPQQTVQ